MHAGFLVQNRKILITVYAVGVFNFLYFPLVSALSARNFIEWDDGEDKILKML